MKQAAWYTCGGRCPPKCNPWVYFILAIVCLVFAIVAIVFAILSKTLFEAQLIDGVNKARFIDNTFQTTDCSNMFVGDATCSGLAYQAWLDGCVKPDVCLRGVPHDFYAFNVTNPAEVLKNGAKPVVQELRPVHAAQTQERIEASVDVDKWNNEGIAHWNETNTFVFADKDETNLLQQKVIVPHVGLLSTVTQAGQQVNTMETLQMLGLCGTYQQLANLVITLAKTAPAIEGIINNTFGDTRSAMKAQYFDAGLTSMAIDYFAYAFGCVAKQDANHSCKFNTDSQADVDLEKKINGTFSETSKDLIFNFIMDTNFSDTTGAATQLILLQKGSLSPSEAAAWIAQLNYAGSYGLANYDTMRNTLFPYTNKSSSAYDPDYEFYPRFIKMTVGQMLGWDNQAFRDRFTGLPITLGFAKPVINGAPTEQYRSSKIPDWKGLDYFKMYNGQTQNCAFDRDCMAQDSFKADRTCTANAACTPNYAAGWDAKFIPGTLNGKGTDEYHKVNAEARLFVGQIFSAATLKNVEIDFDWRGVKVDRWTLADIDFRTENCDGSEGNGSPGIDCDSPRGTFNLGYFSSPDPTTTRVPVFASLPHFTLVAGSSSRENYHPGDRVSIVSCTGDAECEGTRDFTVEIYTEPISGALLNGQQRLQLNIAFPPTANGETGGMTEELLMPAFWLNKHQTAFGFQLDSVKKIQSGSTLFNVLMGILIAVGVVLVICAVILAFLGWRRRKALLAASVEAAAVAK
ncbi:hypothetical protein FOZ60_007553 [Perkinsus olseni]|uniref:Uncharacterized protein n=1 Tax=Perkinsus olseni TaxID=32597 RepID=A0A7J6PMY5_PEROL|nr:hypothetical protein FOZ60_007553 [Perkinsus olseni]